MLIINTPEDVQDLLDLALEIQEVEVCPWKEAVHRAFHELPRLACDIENDVRYELPHALPGEGAPIEIHTSWSVPPRGEPAAPVVHDRVRELVR